MFNFLIHIFIQLIIKIHLCYLAWGKQINIKCKTFLQIFLTLPCSFKIMITSYYDSNYHDNLDVY